MSTQFLPLIALLTFGLLIIQAKEPMRIEEGIVNKVADGDTVQVVTDEGMKLKVRLYGIDAPELYLGPVNRMERKPIEPWRSRSMARR